MWRHQVDGLAQSHQVIVPDLPGFGKSPMNGPSQSDQGDRPLSIPGMAEELVRMLDQLKIEQVTFCGLSMGGYIGWQFWRSYPDRLAGLIACNTRAAADTEVVARARRVSAENVRSSGTEKLAADMIPKLFAASSLEKLPSEVAETRQVILSTNRETVAQALEAMAPRPDATPWLSEIKIPTLFIAGAEDGITPSDEMKANADLVEGSTFVEIPQAGHLSPLENPEEFNRVVSEFMD